MTKFPKANLLNTLRKSKKIDSKKQAGGALALTGAGILVSEMAEAQTTVPSEYVPLDPSKVNIVVNGSQATITK